MPIYTTSTTLPVIPVTTSTAPAIGAGNEAFGASGAGVIVEVTDTVIFCNRLVAQNGATLILRDCDVVMSFVGGSTFTVTEGDVQFIDTKIRSSIADGGVQTWGGSGGAKTGDGVTGRYDNVLLVSNPGTSTRWNNGAIDVEDPIEFINLRIRRFIPQFPPGNQFPGTAFGDEDNPSVPAVQSGVRYNYRIINVPNTDATRHLFAAKTVFWECDHEGWTGQQGGDGTNSNQAINMNPAAVSATLKYDQYVDLVNGKNLPATLPFGQRGGAGIINVSMTVAVYQAWRPLFLDAETRVEILDIKIKQITTTRTIARKPAEFDNTVVTYTGTVTATSILVSGSTDVGFLIEQATATYSAPANTRSTSTVATAINATEFEVLSYTHETYDQEIDTREQVISTDYLQDKNFASEAPAPETNILESQTITGTAGTTTINHGLTETWNSINIENIQPTDDAIEGAVLHLEWTMPQPAGQREPLISYEADDGVKNRIEVTSAGRLAKIDDGAPDDTLFTTSSGTVSFTGTNHLFAYWRDATRTVNQTINALLRPTRVWRSDEPAILDNDFTGQVTTAARVTDIRVVSINYRGIRYAGFGALTGIIGKITFTPTTAATVPVLAFQVTAGQASATISYFSNRTIRVSYGTGVALLTGADGNLTVNLDEENTLVFFVGTAGGDSRLVGSLNGTPFNDVDDVLPLPSEIIAVEAIERQNGATSNTATFHSVEVGSLVAAKTTFLHSEIEAILTTDNYFGTPASTTVKSEMVTVINGTPLNDIDGFTHIRRLQSLNIITGPVAGGVRIHVRKIEFSAINDAIRPLGLTHTDLENLNTNRDAGVLGGTITAPLVDEPTGAIDTVESENTFCGRLHGDFGDDAHQIIKTLNPLATLPYASVTTDLEINTLDKAAAMIARLCYDNEATEISAYADGSTLVIQGGLDLFSATTNDHFSNTQNYGIVADRLEFYINTAAITRGARFTKVRADIETDGIGLAFDIEGEITGIALETTETRPATLPLAGCSVDGKIILHTDSTDDRYLYVENITSAKGLLVEKSAGSAAGNIYVHGLQQSAHVRFGPGVLEAPVYANIIINAGGDSAIAIQNNATGALIAYQDNTPTGDVADQISIPVNATDNPIIDITVRKQGYTEFVAEQEHISQGGDVIFNVRRSQDRDGAGDPLFTAGASKAGVTFEARQKTDGTDVYYINLVGTPNIEIYTLLEIYQAGQNYSITQTGILEPIPARITKLIAGTTEILFNGYSAITIGAANIAQISGGDIVPLDQTVEPVIQAPLTLPAPDTRTLGDIAFSSGAGGGGGGGASTNDLIEAMRTEWGSDWTTASAQATTAATQATGANTQATTAATQATGANTQATTAATAATSADNKADTILANQATITGNQATINGKADGLATEHATIITNQGTIDGKVDNAVTQATTAATQATGANTQATQANTHAGTAASESTAAAASAAQAVTDLGTLATTAASILTHTESAETQATEANAHAGEAETQATTAATQATEANAHAAEAETQATTAATQATTAATQATQANTHAAEASTQATTAATQATTAATQATEANTHAETAATQATEANTHAQGAETQATEANTHAAGAETQATNAAAQATTAATQATAAATAATTAATEAAAAKEQARQAKNNALA